MKKLYTVLVFILCTMCSKETFASHIVGADLVYTWVSDSTYLITFKFYRDCMGVSAPPSISLCYKNSCNTNTYTKTLTAPALIYGTQPNGINITMNCPNYTTTCNGGLLPGFQEWWYQGTVTLPYKCSNWTFSIDLSTRNTDNNLSNSIYDDFYIEATLNNLVAPTNSSADFTVKPAPYIDINLPYTYNAGAVDINNDSLGFQMIQPRAGNGCGTASAIPFVTATPSFNLINNPIAANNTFVLDPVSGSMHFIPSLLGSYVMALKATEYRNQVAIGSTMRDIRVTIVGIGTPASELHMDSSAIPFTGTKIDDCVGSPLNFCFAVKSADTTVKLIANDNHLLSLPGSTVTYTNLHSDSVRCCVSWTPGFNDQGYKILAITFLDSNCTTQSVPQGNTYAFLISVKGVATIADTTICAGSSISLPASGGTTYSWSVLPGGSPLSSLSCTTCADPVATPTVTTTYVVSSSVSGCSGTDTVTVTVSPSIPVPVVTLTGTTLSTTNNPAYTYQWYRNDTAISGANSFSYTPTRDGSYTVRVTNASGCSKISAPFIVTLGVNNISTAKSIDIYPNPATTTIYVDAPVSVNITMNNMAGQQVLQCAQATKVDIRQVPAGVYIIKATDDSGRVLKILKIVKLAY